MSYNVFKVVVVFFLLTLIFEYNFENKDTYRPNYKSKKIDVYLLGTFHFAQTDSTYNVLDEKHQRSIHELCELIVDKKPNKVFLERQPEYEYQNKINGLYLKYLSTQRPIKAKNEIFQLGFRIAKALKHNRVYLCDHPGSYGHLNNIAVKYADAHNQEDILNRTRLGTVTRKENLVDEDSIMHANSLLDYIRWINSEEVMASSHASYVSNWPLLGSNDYYNYDEDNTLLGSEVIADWYRRNIHIYTKMINQVDYKSDEAIVLIIGGDHIPIIKSLFDSNPFFNVVDADNWLNKDI